MVEIGVGIVLLKFTFFIFKFVNLSFGHSVAIFSLRVATASWLKSNLRPSSKISPKAKAYRRFWNNATD